MSRFNKNIKSASKTVNLAGGFAYKHPPKLREKIENMKRGSAYISFPPSPIQNEIMKANTAGYNQALFDILKLLESSE